MILPLISHRKSKRKTIADLRKQMLTETSAFLTWVLEIDRGLSQIPRRPVAEGGFKALVSQPSSRQIIDCWWARMLEWGHISLGGTHSWFSVFNISGGYSDDS